MTRIAALQMNSSDVVADNLQQVDDYLKQAQAQQVKLVLLPENFCQMPRNHSQQYSEQDGNGEVQAFLSTAARKYGLWLVAGSLALQKISQKKPTASCLVYSDTGERVARYDKIHLYDVDVPGDQVYRESNSYQAGTTCDNIQVVDTPFIKLGLSICYDLRFPELYRRLVQQGAELICVPAAFTARTGQVHWQSLLQARAIENLSYVLAAGQYGEHVNARQTWGHSMIIDPWGTIQAQKETGSGLVISEIDLTKLKQLRTRFPVLTHQRLTIL